MGRENEATIKFKADISELKANIQQANRQIRLANAEFQAVAASIDDWEKSTEGVSEKIQSLNKILTAEEAKLESLNKQHALTVKQYGENSVAAQELEIKIKKQEAAVNKTKKQVGDYQKKLSDLEQESENAQRSAEDLSGAFDDTEETAGKLKQKVGALKDGFTIFKGVVADLAADGIRSLVGGLKDLMTASDKAHNKLQAQTGASAKEMEKFSEQMDDIYKSGIGDSLEEIADAMATVKQQTKEVDPSKLKEMTENAIVLQDTFNMDVADSVRTVNMMMKKFGITGEEAYNLIVQGAQSGLDQNGNLLDTINEYGPKFQQMGFTAEEMFNSLASGAKNGVFDLDKLGDAVNEFSIRVKDGTADNAFKDLGLDVQETAKAFGKGGDAAKQAFKKVLAALQSVEDPLERNRLGVALFGTMWEDTGGDCILALSEMQGELKATEKAMESVKNVRYEDIGTEFTKLGRTVQTDILMPLAKKLLPKMKEFVNWTKNNLSTLVPIAASAGAAIGTIFVVNKVSKFVTSIKTLITTFKSLSASIKTAQTAQGLLSSGLSALKSPAGIATLAITGLAAAILVVCKNTDSYYEKHKQMETMLKDVKEKTEATAGAYLEMSDATKKSGEAILQEYGHYSSLLEELGKITDANGKVKKGYEDRAAVICGTLYDAFGVEIEMIDGTVKNLDQLTETYKKLIATQMLEAEIANNRTAYEEAKAYWDNTENIEAYNAALEAVAQAEQNVKEAQERLNKAQEEHGQWVGTVSDAFGLHSAAITGAENDLKKYQEQLDEANEQLGVHQMQMDDAAQRIANFEKATETLYTGSVKNMENAAEVLSRNLITAEHGTKTSLERQYRDRKKHYDNLVKLSKTEGAKVSDTALKEAKKASEAAKAELDKFNRTMEQSGEKTKKTVETAGSSSASSVKSTVQSMEEQIRGAGFLVLMQSKMDEMKSGVTSKQTTVKSSMLGVVSAVISAMKSGDYWGAGSSSSGSFISGMASQKGSTKQTGKEVAQSGKSGMEAVKSNKSGENFGYGYGNGMWDTRSFVYNIGWKIAQMALQGLRDGQDEHSPAKESAKSGDNFVLGYVNKIRAGVRLAKQAGSDLAKAAVGSLESNTMDLKSAVGSASYRMQGGTTAGGVSGGGGTVYNQYFTQNNYSPKSLSRLEIYRQTHNALQFAKGG